MHPDFGQGRMSNRCQTSRDLEYIRYSGVCGNEFIHAYVSDLLSRGLPHQEGLRRYRGACLADQHLRYRGIWVSSSVVVLRNHVAIFMSAKSGSTAVTQEQ